MTLGSPSGSARRLLFSRDQIAQRVVELAADISRDYPGGDLLLVGVLTGAFVFVADLARALTVPVEIDFIGLSSYRQKTQPGTMHLTKDLTIDARGRDVLVVEDIVDTGSSLREVITLLSAREPRTLRTCVLIDKRWRRATPVPLGYVGFTIDRGFVIGYGIDYAGAGRSLPDIHCLPE